MVGKATISSGSQFTHLLANSRLAGHSPVIPQIYTAPQAQIARGDFGLKRSLPSKNKPLGSLRYVEVEALDTREGQTIWSEREHEVLLRKRFGEMNVRLGRSGVQLRGRLGPRISTTYDPSTKRSVPTTYENVSNPNLKEHLQNEARQGQGPIYRTNLHAGNSMSIGLDLDGPFASKSGDYTVKVPVPVNFHSMDEKQFEKYIEHIRRQRPVYQKIAALRTANQERHKLALRLEQERQKISTSNSSNTIPDSISESQLPLPENAFDQSLDLWDESRNVERGKVWQTWLHERDGSRSSLPSDTTLPSNPAPGGRIRNTPMHPSGGLQYGKPDHIQTRLLADHFPGRIVERPASRKGPNRFGNHNTNSLSVAVGGQIASLPLKSRSNTLRLVDWTQRSPEDGSMMFKPEGSATLDLESRTTFSLPIWSDQSGKKTKSASAASMVAEKTAKLAASENQSDPLMKHTLSSQYGQINLNVRNETQGSSLARGVPGSVQWAGEIDGRLGYRSGEDENAPLDYSNLSGMTNGTRRSEFDRVFSKNGDNVVGFDAARGVGSGMYSSRERNRARRQKLEKEARKNQSAASAATAAGTIKASQFDALLSLREGFQEQNSDMKQNDSNPSTFADKSKNE